MTKFKAGKYYIGDLCYVIPYEPVDEWEEFCNLTMDEDTGKCLDGEFPWKGGKLWCNRTFYGDGVYNDQDDHQYGVDAGLIGCIPFELCTERNETKMKRLGRVVEFDKPFTCAYNEGVFKIGHILIDTSFENEELEEEPL